MQAPAGTFMVWIGRVHFLARCEWQTAHLLATMYCRSSVTESVTQSHDFHKQESCRKEEMYVRFGYIVEGLQYMLNLERRNLSTKLRGQMRLGDGRKWV